MEMLLVMFYAEELKNMLSDLSFARYARDLAVFGSNVPKYNYTAVKRLQRYHSLSMRCTGRTITSRRSA